jgi:hypothetical protein
MLGCLDAKCVCQNPQLCVCVFVYVCISIYMDVYMLACGCVYMFACACVCTREYMYRYLDASNPRLVHIGSSYLERPDNYHRLF